MRRLDGTVLGFTDHDQDVNFGGVAFRANSGLDARTLQTATGLSVDNGQAVGALTAAAITEADIRGGKYDKAEVEHWLVDWQRPGLRVQVFRGTIGEIRRSSAGFEAELRGLAEALNMPIGRSIIRHCDRILGDDKCRFNLATAGFWTETQALEGSTGSRHRPATLERVRRRLVHPWDAPLAGGCQRGRHSFGQGRPAGERASRY